MEADPEDPDDLADLPESARRKRNRRSRRATVRNTAVGLLEERLTAPRRKSLLGE
jgi:hypothetical protein